MITLDAMAIDRANNIGKARSIRVRVQNAVNATRLQADPPLAPAPKGETKPNIATAPKSSATTKPSPTVVRPAAPGALVAALPKASAAAPKLITPVTPPVTRAQMAKAPAPAGAAPRGQAPGSFASSLEGPRATQPSAPRRIAPPRSAPARLPSAAPTGDRAILSARTAFRPTLMARAIVPPAPHASRAAEVTAEPAAPRSRPMAASPDGGSPASLLSETRTVTPPLQRPAAPKSSPSPAKGAPRVASLPRPAETSAPSPALEGGRLRLPVYVARPVADSPARSRSHVVQEGERLAEIARRYRVTPQSILVASGIHGDAVAPGRKLTIPGTFDIVVNNQRIEFDVNPRVEKGLPIAPFRHIFEHAGGVVVYYPGDRSVKAAKPDKEVRLKVGSAEAMVNGAVVVMERPAQIDSGRTMVPVRFVTEALDMVAEYDVKTGNIYLVRK
jgi:LysM repeat protein